VPESSGAENLVSVAVVFAAAEACRTGQPQQIAAHFGTEQPA
jgi:hypothetical protein